nr:hypothetical protein [Clostridia bacterium]
MNEQMTLSEKDIKMRVFAELLRNFIFLTIVVFLLQPIVYLVTDKLFMGHIKYYRYKDIYS